MSMPTQRCSSGSPTSTTRGGSTDDGGSSTRRGYLAAAGAAVATGGCVLATGQVPGRSGGTDPVSVLAAGSLQRALSTGLRDAVDVPVRVEARGSVAAARLVADGRRDPDVVAMADTTLFDSILDAPWFARIAGNALVVAYDDDSEGGRRAAAADRWFEPVVDGQASLGRTDPALDPLGYRTLFMLELTGDRLDRPGLAERVTAPDQVYPETSLLSRLETGSLDAAVVYRNMAIERGYAAVDLPAAVDLSDADRADAYREASYTLDSGQTVRGAPIAYGARARSDDPATRAVFAALTEGSVLADHGFVVPDEGVTFEGAVPRAYRE